MAPGLTLGRCNSHSQRRISAKTRGQIERRHIRACPGGSTFHRPEYKEHKHAYIKAKCHPSGARAGLAPAGAGAGERTAGAPEYPASRVLRHIQLHAKSSIFAGCDKAPRAVLQCPRRTPPPNAPKEP